MNDLLDDAALDKAMRDLLRVGSVDDVRQAIDNHPILMSPTVIKPIIEEANEAAKRGDHFYRVWLMVHVYVLGRCHERGIEKGFAEWQNALSDQIGTAQQSIKYYLDGNTSALNDAIEQALWALMGARRPGPLAQYWDPLFAQLSYLILQWFKAHKGGAVALALLTKLHQENAERVDKSDPSWPSRTMLYASACFYWFEWNGDEAALDRAIELETHAVKAHADPEWISGLGRLHLLRFEVKRGAEDLRAAIDSQRWALRETASGHGSLRADALDRLGMALRTSFEESGIVGELNEAIANHEEAVRISPGDSPLHPAHLGNLATALITRYVLNGDSAARRRAGELLRQEVELCSPSHPLRADALANLASWLTVDTMETLPAQREEAIEALREAVKLAADRHVRWVWELSLAEDLLSAARASTENHLRQEAHQRVQTVLAWANPAWPHRAEALSLLGELQADAGLEEAGDTLAEAVELGIKARPDAARRAADYWRTWAISKNRIDDLKKASVRSLDVLDALSARQKSVYDQLQWRRRARPTVEDAAYALANAGASDFAVAHLERGRATVLRKSLLITTATQSVDDTFRAVLPSMGLVYLVAADAAGLALIPGKNGVATTPLPSFTVDRVRAAVVKLVRAQEQRIQPGGATVWRQHLESVTRWLDEAVVDHLRGSLANLGPNVAFLTDGLVGLLPWAAAWAPDPTAPRGRRYLIDLPIDLTIAPTARVLAAGLSQAATVSSDHVLIVAPSGGAAKGLRHVDAEAAAVAAARPGALTLRSNLTPVSVLKAAQGAEIVHFACHGRVNILEPLKSQLIIGDGKCLEVADLLGAEARPRRLVVLSACETSAAGIVDVTEAIGFPVAFLRLGFAGVVGSLWPIRDDGAALLMARFHELAVKSSPASALAQAQRWLRGLSREDASEILNHPVEQDFSEIETWAAFTFTGA